MAELKARITADASGFHAAVKSAKSALLGFTGFMASFMTAKKVFRFGEELVNELSKIGQVSRELGITVEEFQKLEAVAVEAGVSVDKLRGAFKGLQTVIQKAGIGDKESLELFNQLGIEFEDLKKKSPFEQFELLSSALKGVKDEFQKSALAQKLFGDGSKETVSVLENFNTVLNNVKDNALVIDSEHIKKAEEFKKAMESLGKTIQILIVESGFIEWLSNVTNEVSKMITEFSKLEKYSFGKLFFQELKRSFGMADLQMDRALTYLPAPTEEEKAAFKKKSDELKKKRDEQKAVELAAERFKVESDAEKAERLRRENAEKALKMLEQEIFYLRMIKDGKEREAEIEREINRLRDQGVDITEDVRKRVEEMVDLKQKEVKDLYRTPAMDISDQLRRIGGTLGGHNIQISLDKERNNLLKQIVENTKKEAVYYL